jgi:hypothetical protein
MTAGPLLVDAFTARREGDATRLVFEYMAATLTAQDSYSYGQGQSSAEAFR